MQYDREALLRDADELMRGLASTGSYERRAARIRAAVAEIDRLSGEVHDCPKCGMACKQCLCVETELAAIRAALGCGEGESVVEAAKRRREMATKAAEATAAILKTELVARDRRIAELEGALKPFAKLEIRLVVNGDEVVYADPNDCRRAAAILAASATRPPEGS